MREWKSMMILANPEVQVEEGALNRQSEGLRRPSRGALNDGALLCFSRTAAPTEFAHLVADLERTVGARVDLRTRTLTGSDPDDLQLRTVFGIQRSPAVVVSGPWLEALSSDIFEPLPLPPYSATADDELDTHPH